MRKITSIIASLVLAFSAFAIPDVTQAHGCHTAAARPSYTTTVREDFYQYAQSGVYFNRVSGHVRAPNVKHVAAASNGASSWMFLEMTIAGSSALARVGYRFDPDGSIHRYRHLRSPTGTTMFNVVESTNRAQWEVDVSELIIRYVNAEPDQIILGWQNNVLYQQPLHTAWDVWSSGKGGNQYRFRFDTNQYQSQFFGTTGVKWGIENAYYVTQYGSQGANLTSTDNHSLSWPASTVSGYDSAYVWDAACF